MFVITAEEYQELCNNYAGFCVNCIAITKDDGVEPDAENYICPDCQQHELMGLENALICGYVEIGEE